MFVASKDIQGDFMEATAFLRSVKGSISRISLRTPWKHKSPRGTLVRPKVKP